MTNPLSEISPLMIFQLQSKMAPDSNHDPLCAPVFQMLRPCPAKGQTFSVSADKDVLESEIFLLPESQSHHRGHQHLIQQGSDYENSSHESWSYPTCVKETHTLQIFYKNMFIRTLGSKLG